MHKSFFILVTALSMGCSLGALAGDAVKGAALYKSYSCATCHAKNGLGVAKVFGEKPRVDIAEGPRIAGLEEKYIVDQMMAIQGRDPKHIRVTETTKEMKKNTKDLSKQDMEDIAAYVSKEINRPISNTYQSTFAN